MLTKNQQIVFNWLNNKLQLPVFAELYKGALYLLDKKPAGYITFVAHAGRDLMNRLAATVNGITSQNDQQKNRLDELQKDWLDEWGTQGINRSNDPESGHLIPYEICEKIKNLIDAHAAGRLRSSDADSLFFSTFLGYNDGVKIGTDFFQEWKDAKKWFLKHTHLRKDNFETDAPSEVQRHFGTLDSLLYDAATSEFGRMRIINDILEETNK